MSAARFLRNIRIDTIYNPSYFFSSEHEVLCHEIRVQYVPWKAISFDAHVMWFRVGLCIIGAIFSEIRSQNSQGCSRGLSALSHEMPDRVMANYRTAENHFNLTRSVLVAGMKSPFENPSEQLVDTGRSSDCIPRSTFLRNFM